MIATAAAAPPSAAPLERRLALRGADGAVYTCDIGLAATGDGAARLRARLLGEQAEPSPLELRAEMLARLIDTAPFVLWQVDRDGIFELSEGGALAMLGLEPGQVVGMSAFEIYKQDPTVLESLHRGLAGTASHTHSQAGELRFANINRPIHDANGEVVGLMGLSLDITTQVKAEAAVREQADRLERMQDLMQAMGTPILQVWDGLLCVPVIGSVNATRARSITETVLAAVTQRSARAVILDLTGVEEIDVETALHFVRIIRAIQLLGARGIVVGIRPAVARTLVEIDVELQVETLNTLQDALSRVLR